MTQKGHSRSLLVIKMPRKCHFNANKLQSGITVASLINEALGEKVKLTVLEATDRLHGRLQTVDLDGLKVLVFLDYDSSPYYSL